MKPATSKRWGITIGIAVIAVGLGFLATQAIASAPVPEGHEPGIYYAPGETVDLPAEQAPSPEELREFNEISKENFRRLVRENPDLEIHDLNEWNE